MNVDLFSLMVKEQILDHDEVVLPGLGVFVAEVVPSSFSDKGYTVNPPYRRLSFRHKPDAIGDSLAQMYAKDNAINIDDASRILTDFLTEMQNVLRKRKAVSLPGLGRLRATKENNFFFVPDEDIDIWPDGFGLHPVSLKFHQETGEEVSEAIGALADIIQVSTSETSVAQEAPEVLEEPRIQEDVKITTQPEIQEEQKKQESETQEPKTQESEPMAVSEIQEESETQTDTGNKKTARKKVLRAVLFSVAGIAACIIFYVAIARLVPGIFDSILYTKDELEIIRQASILP